MFLIPERLKNLAFVAFVFASGVAASQFLQPALAQSGTGPTAISAAGDGSAWLLANGFIFHCRHEGQTIDACHRAK